MGGMVIAQMDMDLSLRSTEVPVVSVCMVNNVELNFTTIVPPLG